VAERQLLIRPGRPRIKVDFALILRLRDVEKMGWMKGSEEYRRRTGQWISRDTFKRRYFEAKATKSPFERAREELEGMLKTWRTTEGRQ
jgi:hypothetical protein